MPRTSDPASKNKDTRDLLRELLKSHPFTANESNVLKALFLRAGVDGSLWMFREEIMQLTGLKKSSVSAVIASLEKSGVLWVTRRNQVPGETAKPNEYQIIWGHVHDTDMTGPGDGHGSGPRDGLGHVHEMDTKEPSEEPLVQETRKKKRVVRSKRVQADLSRKVPGRTKEGRTSSRKLSSGRVHQGTMKAGPRGGHGSDDPMEKLRKFRQENLTQEAPVLEPESLWEQEQWL